MNFQGIPHGGYITSFKGVKIEAKPSDSSCYTPQGAGRVIITGNPLFRCVPGTGNPALGSTVGGALVIQQGPDEPRTRCVRDCTSGGQFTFTFPREVLIRSVIVVNMNTNTLPAQAILRSRINGEILTTVFTIQTDGKNEFDKETLNAEGFELTIVFFKGGAVANIEYDTCEGGEEPPRPNENEDVMCQQLVRAGDMELNPLQFWKARNHELVASGDGRGGGRALLSSPRPRTFLGPRQKLIGQFRNCITPGSIFRLTAYVRLFDPELPSGRNGVSCSTTGNIVPKNKRKGNGHCPGFQVKMRDGRGNTLFLNLRRYERSWNPNGWNKLEGILTTPRISRNWDGQIRQFRLLIANMDPNLSLLLDDVTMSRI